MQQCTKKTLRYMVAKGVDSAFSTKRGPGCPNAEKGCSKLLRPFTISVGVGTYGAFMSARPPQKKTYTHSAANLQSKQSSWGKGVRPEAPGILTHTLSFASPEAIRHRQTCARADTNGPRPFPIAHLGSDPWSKHSSY